MTSPTNSRPSPTPDPPAPTVRRSRSRQVLPLALTMLLMTLLSSWILLYYWQGIRRPHWTLGGHRQNVGSLAFSRDGNTLISGGWDGVVGIWDVTEAGLRSRRSLLGRFTLSGDEVRSVALAPDGTEIAAASDVNVTRWSYPEGTQKQPTWTHGAYALSVAYSPDGSLVASSGDQDCTVRIRNTRTGAVVREFTDHHDFAGGLAFSPDGKCIATSDRGSVRIREVASGATRLTVDYTVMAHSIAFSLDGQWLAIASGSGDTLLVSLRDPQNRRKIGSGDTTIAFTPDSQRVLTLYMGHLAVYDITSGERTGYVVRHQPSPYPQWLVALFPPLNTPPAPPLTTFALSPDGRKVAYGEGSNIVVMFNPL